MIIFNLQHFAMAKGATLGNLAPDEDVLKKKKKVPTLPTVNKAVATTNVPTLTSTPVESEADKQRRLNAEADKKRFEEDKALQAELEARGEEDLTRVSFEERKRRQAESQKTGDATETTSTGHTLAELEEQKRQKQLQAMKDAFNQAFETTKGQIDVEREALVPRFRTERSRIGVEDVMSRTGAEKIQATQGLSGAGARSQSDIAQNVITAGALGQSRTRQSEREAELDRLEVEAARQRDFGIAQAESDMTLAEQQFMIDQEKNRIARELKAIDLADARAREDFVRELELADKETLINLQNDLERDNKLLDDELAEARAQRDFDRVTQLEEIKSQNNIKLQGIRDANAMARVQAGTAGNLSEIAARGEQDRLTDATKETTATDEEPQFSNSAVNSALTNAINASKQRFKSANEQIKRNNPLAPTSSYTLVDEANAVKQFLVDNADNLSPQQGNDIMFEYKIDPKEIARLLGGN